MKRRFLKHWLIGCGVAILTVAAVGGYGIYQIGKTFSMQNQVYQEVKSPDGKCTATFAYSDGPTYGYYFVCLQPTADWRSLRSDDPIPHDEVAEVAAEGLDSVAWVSSHKLVINYDKFIDNEKTDFVLRKTVWRDVQIVYRGS